MSRSESTREGMPGPEPFSLRRWSQRKHAAARAEAGTAVPAPAPAESRPEGALQPRDAAGPGVPSEVASSVATSDAPSAAAGAAIASGAQASASAGATIAPGPQGNASAAAVPLPPIDSLTPDSDFAAFMRPEVDEVLKRGALKKLFSDPRFNVMDGLDIYIDDYTRSDPIEPSLARELLSRLKLGGGDEPPAAPEVAAAEVVVSSPDRDVPPATPDVPGSETAPATAGADPQSGSEASGPADAVDGASQPARPSP
ncbi:MAG: DUF3306 domain-containing protein [Candidatus Levyibacteriota bacterium]